MITGRQIREGRKLLRMGVLTFAGRAKINPETLRRAEGVEGEAPITLAQEVAIRRALERDGVEVSEDGARLRKPDAL